MFLLRRKVVRRALLASLGLLILAGLAAFVFPQELLCVDSGSVQADAIVVLGGGSWERPIRAAELFQAGAAPRIIISGQGDAGINQRLLVSKGVPPSAIQVEPNSTSTRQNAQFTIPLLRAAGAKRVILVTSWYHSRRALRCFRHYGPDLVFYSRPAYYAYARQDWERQGITRYLRNEYVKMLGYWVVYGVCPL